MEKESYSALRWLIAVAVVGLLIRVFIWYAYEPIAYGDTPSYLRLARSVSGFTLERYDGTRVPGYPFFLAILGMDAARVWLVQLTLGWLMSLLLFGLMWGTTGSARLGALLALLYDLIPGQLLFESNLLTESLTSFLVALSMALLVALNRARAPGLQLAASGALGIAASLAGMVRPLFFLLPVWLLPFVYVSGNSGRGLKGARLAIFSLGPLIILGGWLGFVRTHYRVLAPTVMGGYHLVQHTGEYFEFLPDGEAAIRDTYIKYRDARIAERGVQVNAIWDAIPELSEVSGLSFYALSRKLQALSIQLILDHPLLYLRNVVEGWIGFWKVPVFWRPEAMKLPFASEVISRLALAGRLVSVVVNGLFLLLVSISLLSRRLRDRIHFDRFALAGAGLILLTSIVQTIVDHGDNPRFLVPLQMMVFYVVLRAGWFLAKTDSVEASVP